MTELNPDPEKGKTPDPEQPDDAKSHQKQEKDQAPKTQDNKEPAVEGEYLPPKDLPKEFDYKIAGRPDFARLSLNLEAGQTVKAEASAMIAMDTNVTMKSKFKGGFKRFLGGESLFINEFTAEEFSGRVTLANGLPGDVFHYHLEEGQENAVFLSSGAFLASGMDVQVDTKFQGVVKGFFSGAGLFLLKCSGHGDVFFNTYGGIVEIDVEDEYTIDNNHIVAFTDELEYKVTKFGGYKSFFLSGEAFVTKFEGRGKIWIQTRKVPAFSAWIWPFRPKKSSN